jgi:hypothetical protein
MGVMYILSAKMRKVNAENEKSVKNIEGYSERIDKRIGN